jgi:two-component system, NarL family, response regulator DevR
MAMSCRFLVVDDSPSAIQGIRSVIESHAEWEICGEAATPSEGIAKATALMPDVVILDLHMQERDGFETAKAILRERPMVPIILYSIFGTAGIVPRSVQVGIRRVVSKADGGPALVSAIREILSSKRLSEG